MYLEIRNLNWRRGVTSFCFLYFYSWKFKLASNFSKWFPIFQDDFQFFKVVDPFSAQGPVTGPLHTLVQALVPTRVWNHEVLKQKTSPVLPAHLMESEATAGTLNGHIMNTYLTSVLRLATASSKSDNVGAVKLNHVPWHIPPSHYWCGYTGLRTCKTSQSSMVQIALIILLKLWLLKLWSLKLWSLKLWLLTLTAHLAWAGSG